MGLFSPDDGLRMSEYLLDKWKSFSDKDFWKEYPEGLVLAILGRPSAFDNSPLVDTLQKAVNELGDVKRRVVMSAVDVNTGNYANFYEDIGSDQFPHAAAASSSAPFVFAPH